MQINFKMEKLFLLKMFALVVMAACITSFTKSGKSTTAESGYYYFYYEQATHDHKWIYISDIAYGERPGTNLTVPVAKEKQRFMNRVKSQYSSQASASDKYYIDEGINYEFKANEEDLIEQRNERLQSAKRNGYKVFYVQL